MVTRIYLIRHCQSMGNIEHKFQGQYDADISPAGEKQLELLGLRFRNEPIDVIYTSPLKRARMTAQAIAKYHNDIEVIDEPGFIEMNVGELENRSLKELALNYPETAEKWDRYPDLCEFPGGETMAEVYERVNRALDRVIAENPGRTVVITTHGGVLRNLYARIQFGEPAGIRKSEVFGNTGVSTVIAEGDRLYFESTNDLSHLPEDMRRPPTKFSFEAFRGSEPV
ncbi:MAG: histidine phosphatase family protein [Acutalibacter sp.]|uniref:histidine phosphatase family protein n=1 Tax=Acutalibacter sp. TaxID=1918636 RepID=UPI002172F14B|nr:histidine phosphatase family protein [Acutalibacter sp.]MCI9224346.1 histidine phosphatase family protein [Acutalibacter sp.]